MTKHIVLVKIAWLQIFELATFSVQIVWHVLYNSKYMILKRKTAKRIPAKHFVTLLFVPRSLEVSII